MAKTMSEGSKKVFGFLKENYSKEYTKHQIAEELGLSLPTVTGSINGLIKKKLVNERIEEVEITSTSGSTKKGYVRYETLAEEGLRFDPLEWEAEQAKIELEAKEARRAEVAAKKAAKLTNVHEEN